MQNIESDSEVSVVVSLLQGPLLKQDAITETDTRSCTSIDNDSWGAELLLHSDDPRLGLAGDRLLEILE